MAAGIQALLQTLYGFYNTVFQPLLALGQYPSLIFFSTVLAGMFSIIYWYLLDIDKQDEIKEKLNSHQEKMKEARSNDNSEKASEHMQETMKLNQKMMKLNIKPMIATMVFVALVFPWLGATFSPAVNLEETGNNTFHGNLSYASQNVPVRVDNTTATPQVTVDNTTVELGENVNALGVEWETKRFGEKRSSIPFLSSGGERTVLKFSAVFVKLPFSIPFAGKALNWLGFYIILAMPLTYIFRKMLGVA